MLIQLSTWCSTAQRPLLFQPIGPQAEQPEQTNHSTSASGPPGYSISATRGWCANAAESCPAKTHFFKIIEQVEQGEKVIISRAGTPVAKVIPLSASVRRSAYGSLRGRLHLAGDWDSPETNASIAALFGVGDPDIFVSALVAQARYEGLPLMTADKQVQAYDVETVNI